MIDPTAIWRCERLCLGTITLAALFVAYLGFLAFECPRGMPPGIRVRTEDTGIPSIHAEQCQSIDDCKQLQDGP